MRTFDVVFISVNPKERFTILRNLENCYCSMKTINMQSGNYLKEY